MLFRSDKTVLKALEVLDKGESFPKAPEQPIEPKVSDEGTKKTTDVICTGKNIINAIQRFNNRVLRKTGYLDIGQNLNLRKPLTQIGRASCRERVCPYV